MAFNPAPTELFPFATNGTNTLILNTADKPDSSAVARVQTILCVADVAGSLASKYFDIADEDGPVRPWCNVPVKAKGSITYGVPVNDDTVVVNGTTFTKADVGSGTEFSTIGELTALVTALSDLSATDNGTVISIVADTAGTAGNSITLSIGGGNTGTLAVSGATLTGGTASSTPPAAPVGGRLIQVDLVEGDANTAVATAFQTALHADSKFTASVDTATVTSTNATAGAIEDSVANGDSGFTVTITTPGVDAISQASLPELTDTEAHVTTGDSRRIAFAILEQLNEWYLSLAPEDRPAMMTVSKTPQAISDSNQQQQTFVIQFTTDISSEVADEPA